MHPKNNNTHVKRGGPGHSRHNLRTAHACKRFDRQLSRSPVAGDESDTLRGLSCTHDRYELLHSLTLTSCGHLLKQPLVQLGFVARLNLLRASQAKFQFLRSCAHIQFNLVHPCCWREFPAVNFSSGFLRMPMKGGGCMLPILESIMPLMNDLWGCELLGTDFTACAFRARRLPAAPNFAARVAGTQRPSNNGRSGGAPRTSRRRVRGRRG